MSKIPTGNISAYSLDDIVYSILKVHNRYDFSVSAEASQIICNVFNIDPMDYKNIEVFVTDKNVKQIEKLIALSILQD